MTSLTTRLRDMLEWDETELKNHDRLHFQYENGVGEHGIRYRCLREGARYQHSKLKPILLALVECVEAMEKISDVDHPSVADKTSWIVMTESICLLARKTLEALEKELEK